MAKDTLQCPNCGNHYPVNRNSLLRKHTPCGSVHASLQERMDRYLERDESTGCLLWTGAQDGHGYGQLNIQGTPEKVHRISYQLAKGEIPDGLSIDHLCRVRLCAEPDHLEAVTLAENTRRELVSIGHPNDKKTHCPKGHPFDKENTRFASRGYGRVCKICRAESSKKYRDRKREEQLANSNEVDAYLTSEDRPRVKRDKWGRYVLNSPVTGDEQPWQRVTTFCRILADEYALGKWQQRMTLKGASLREDIVAVAYSLDVKKDAKQMDGLVEDLKDAAGGSKSANLGTALHSFAEAIDHGGSLDDVPPAHRADIQAYRDTLADWGISVAPRMTERITCVPKYQVAGTFDQIFHIPADSRLGMQWGLKSDVYAIGDKKTGRDLSFNAGEISIQLALYAMGSNQAGVWNASNGRWEDAPKVREDIGIVVHLPVGEAECTLLAVDLTRGAKAAELSARARDWRKNRNLLSPLDQSVLPEEELGKTNPLWELRFATVSSRTEASELYKEAKADPGMDSVRLKCLVTIGKMVLSQ